MEVQDTFLTVALVFEKDSLYGFRPEPDSTRHNLGVQE